MIDWTLLRYQQDKSYSNSWRNQMMRKLITYLVARRLAWLLERLTTDALGNAWGIFLLSFAYGKLITVVIFALNHDEYSRMETRCTVTTLNVAMIQTLAVWMDWPAINLKKLFKENKTSTGTFHGILSRDSYPSCKAITFVLNLQSILSHFSRPQTLLRVFTVTMKYRIHLSTE